MKTKGAYYRMNPADEPDEIPCDICGSFEDCDCYDGVETFKSHPAKKHYIDSEIEIEEANEYEFDLQTEDLDFSERFRGEK